jgi:LmbE family N-acetylglucosaminyl deacetylase
MLDPSLILKGVVVIVAPHMDDAVLACGGTISKFPQKDKIHIIYATDGSQSPKSILPLHNKDSKKLTKIRRQEAREALQILGVPKKNLHFLNFPDGQLKHYSTEFSKSFIDLIQQIKAAHILIPFRYDSHPDHLAVNDLTTKAIEKAGINNIQLFEYFVYYNFRLLPGRDMRKYINPSLLYKVEIHHESYKKRRALQCFKSQVTNFYEWQERPILSQTIIDESCQNQELFLLVNKSQNLINRKSLFIGKGRYIPIIHFLEPNLKKIKDKLIEAIKILK